MNFAVNWDEDTLQDLAALWTAANSAERRAITRACEQVDQLLGTDPLGVGESRPFGFRFVYIAPLAIQYHIADDERTINIVEVRHIRPRRSH
jgi:hypothetical protein